MPAPRKGESQNDFIDRCVPVVLQEGTAKNRKQAVAICGSMWRKAKGRRSMDGDRDVNQRQEQRYSVSAPQLHRAAKLTSVDEESRTVEMVWTTGERTLRRGLFTGPWYEELEVSERAVLMDRLKSGRANLLDSHRNMGVGSVLGVVEKAWIDNGKGHAKVRFARTAEVEPVWQNVKDGILRNISVGYRVFEFQEERRKARNGEQASDDGMVLIRRATRWEPGELSLVSVPIDSQAFIRGGDAADEGGFNRCEVLVEDRIDMDDDVQATGTAGGGDQTQDRGQDQTQDRGQDRGQTQPQAPSPAQPPQAQPARSAAAGEDGIDPELLRRAIDNGVQAQLQAERERVAFIREQVRTFGLDDSFADELIRGSDGRDKITSRILEKLAADRRANPPQRRQSPVIDGRVVVTRGEQSEDDTQFRGMQDYLLHRAGRGEMTDEARPFRGTRMLDMAREFLELRGVRSRGLMPLEIAEQAMMYRAPIGYHTTTDFPNLLQGVGERILLDAYAAEARNYQQFFRRRTAPDYRALNIYEVGSSPNLEQRNEAGEFIYKTFGEAATSYRLVQYGVGLAFTREMLINDDLDVLAQFPAGFAVSAARKENDAAFAVLLANAALADGTALFHANHGNLGTAGAPSAETLAEGYELMSLQTDVDGNTVNLVPAFILAPPRLRITIAQLLADSYVPTAPSGVLPREFGADLGRVYEPRLQNGVTLDGTTHAGSASEWYLVANARQSGLEYAYLEGEEGPQIDTQNDFDRKGVKMTCLLSFAAVAVHHRGVFKNEWTGS